MTSSRVGAVEEGIPLQQALGKVSPNVLGAIKPRHNPTQETLDLLLGPFKLKLSLALLRKGEGKHVA